LPKLLNPIGDVSKNNGNVCSGLQINLPGGEVISNMTLTWSQSQSQITQVTFLTSMGRTLTQGLAATDAQSQTIKFDNSTSQLLGFVGT
jgi:hypothetical protein